MRHIERNTDVKIKFFKCGTQFTMDQMRMDPNGKNLICRNCLERKVPSRGLDDDSLSSRPFKANPQGLPKSSDAKSSDKIQYFCKACKYNFTRAAHIPVNSCPYCSNTGGIVKKGSSKSIVREVEDMMGDDE